jgi:hypothetical protein
MECVAQQLIDTFLVNTLNTVKSPAEFPGVKRFGQAFFPAARSASHSSQVYCKIVDLIKTSWQIGNPGQVFDDRQPNLIWFVDCQTRIRLVCWSPKQTIPVSQLSKQNNFGLLVTKTDYSS